MYIIDLHRIIKCIGNIYRIDIKWLLKLDMSNNACVDEYLSYGFILGDSTLIKKNGYFYIELKSTKIFTIIAGLVYLYLLGEKIIYTLIVVKSGRSP